MTPLTRDIATVYVKVPSFVKIENCGWKMKTQLREVYQAKCKFLFPNIIVSQRSLVENLTSVYAKLLSSLAAMFKLLKMV